MDNVSVFYPYTSENIHPGFSIDCIVFAYHSKKIRILLRQFDCSDYWQLPGSFMLKTENAEEAANRTISCLTGVNEIFLQQFHLFSDINRTQLQQNQSFIENEKKISKIDDPDTEKWFLNRFVSLAFYTLVKYESVKIQKEKGMIYKWFDVADLPSLYSDHHEIIHFLFNYLKEHISVVPFAQKTLPEKFTMSDLRKIYEVIFDKTFDRRNFARKILSTDILIELDEVSNGSTYKPTKLYKFNPEKGLIDFSFLK